MLVDISKIRRDGGTQVRRALDAEMVAKFVDDIRAGDSMQPVIVYNDGAAYWLADGFHRVAAHLKEGKPLIEAEIRNGDARKAFLASIKLNEHTPLTAADRKACVERMVKDGEWSQWSDREIGRRCGVNHETVGKTRKELSGGNRQIHEPTKETKEKPMPQPENSGGADVIPLHREPKKEPEKRKATRNGKTYEINTSNIGKKLNQKENGHASKGKPKHLSTKAWTMLKNTPAAKDRNQRHQLERLTGKLQLAVARMIADGDAANVKEAVDAITNGAPVDDWGRAYTAVMKLPADDRVRLCRMILNETQESANGQ
jgi:hypothetical protein